MTYLVITDNLVDNLDDLDINELKYEKIKFHFNNLVFFLRLAKNLRYTP